MVPVAGGEAADRRSRSSQMTRQLYQRHWEVMASARDSIAHDKIETVEYDSTTVGNKRDDTDGAC